ncbi:MAG: helix-turn-helix domain-containing protein, partial [Bacteroidales bacterium]
FFEAERGVAFSVQDAKNVEKFMTGMISHSGIEKIINFFQVLKIMCFSTTRRQLCTENYKIRLDTSANKRIAKVYNYIRENYNRHISLEDISKVAEMKPFSFSKYFKRNTGSGYIEYLNQVRANRACYLLRETVNTIHEIAKECGFSSVSNFNKQFKKILGISPTEYRAQHEP